MSRVIGIAILLAGGLMLYQVFDGLDLFVDRVSKVFTGGQIHQTLWYEMGGVACIVIGLFVANSSRPD